MTLNKIAWQFNKEKYTDGTTFSKAVGQYQKDIYKDDNRWHPDEVVFDIPELNIQYMAWLKGASDLLENETLITDDQDAFEEEPDEDNNGYYQVEVLAHLKADNGRHFTALEFLLKTHNQQANKELGDHVFFEGTDENPQAKDGLPTCFIACGS
jgi:hypothetical protein